MKINLPDTKPQQEDVPFSGFVDRETNRDDSTQAKIEADLKTVASELVQSVINNARETHFENVATETVDRALSVAKENLEANLQILAKKGDCSTRNIQINLYP